MVKVFDDLSSKCKAYIITCRLTLMRKVMNKKCKIYKICYKTYFKNKYIQ